MFGWLICMSFYILKQCLVSSKNIRSGFLIRNHSSSPQNRIYYLSKKSFDLQAACFFLDLIVNKPSLLKSHSNKSYLYHQKIIDNFWPSQWANLDGFVFNWEGIKPWRAPDKEARPNPFMLAWVTNVLTSPKSFRSPPKICVKNSSHPSNGVGLE